MRYEVMIVLIFVVLVFFVVLSPIKRIRRKIKKEKIKAATIQMAKDRQLQEERLSIVYERSERIKRIQTLNNEFFFYQINSNRILTISCETIEDLRAIDLRDGFVEVLVKELPDIRDVINQAEHNSTQYQEYIVKYNFIINYPYPSDSENYSEFDFFEEIEKDWAERLKKTPVVNPCITVEAECNSIIAKQDKRKAKKSTVFDFDEIKECYALAESLVPNQSSAQVERNLMTNSLRYDIMKRDGFRCVLCGASAKDGAKLHVDHIFPVSKGGKTEPDNLRTLCESCNRGKGAKYDFNGEN